VAGIVDAPLVKSVSAAVTVQEAERRARLSVTVTGPIGALIWVPGAPEPRLALAGTDSVNAPDVTVIWMFESEPSAIESRSPRWTALGASCGSGVEGAAMGCWACALAMTRAAW